MRPELAPETELGTPFKPKARRLSWYPRSIGRLMALVALSGLILAAYSERSRTPAPLRGRLVRTAPRGFRVPPPAPVQPMPLRDPAVLVAPPGIDDAMIVTARTGIDNAMIVTPGRIRVQPLMVPPPMPTPGEPRSAPLVPWQPNLRVPRR
jgi:hypothetical protein